MDDKEHGTAIGYYEDGSKHWEAQYVDGKMHGKEISYNRGRIEESGNLLRGRQMAMHGTADFLPRGRIEAFSQSYPQNLWTAKWHGTYVVYHEDEHTMGERYRPQKPPYVDDKLWLGMARGLRTARTDLSGLKPYTKTAKRSPEKTSNPLRSRSAWPSASWWPISLMVEAMGVELTGVTRREKGEGGCKMFAAFKDRETSMTHIVYRL